jgi:CRP-like cAMP-binding protein
MASADAVTSLRSIPLFSRVAQPDLEQIASHLIERRYPRNTTIVEEGLPGDYMYILREGRVKVTKLSEDGREKILDFLEAGSFVGEMSLLERGPRSASVKTLAPVKVLALSRTDFINLLRKSPDLAIAVIQELSRRIRSVNEQASSLSFQRVKERTMGLLERLAKDPSADGERLVTPILTHQQIADMVGTSRETVTRVVKDLKQSGWLRQEAALPARAEGASRAGRLSPGGVSDRPPSTWRGRLRRLAARLSRRLSPPQRRGRSACERPRAASWLATRRLGRPCWRVFAASRASRAVPMGGGAKLRAAAWR